MKSAPVLSEQSHDIQGMLKSGFGWLKFSRFWLLTIREGKEDQARRWLADLVKSGLVVSAKRVGNKNEGLVNAAVAIAFSSSGLVKLGCEATAAHPFPTPFQSGMGSELRARLLRDEWRQWRWSDGKKPDGSQTVHVLIAEWAERAGVMSDPDPAAFSTIIVDNNCKSFRTPDGDTEEKLHEPFGFRDGLAQPVIRGLREEQGAALKQARRDAGDLYDDRVVEPGEFILGYRNEYDELTYCPDVKGWTDPNGRFTLNGSYLAVRQIKQNVEAFRRFEEANKAITGSNAATVGEMLMGRRKTGLALSWQGPLNAKLSDSAADAFRYRVEDANGFVCPKGAHVRRANPRDALGLDVRSSLKSSKLHRLLRRGRPYLETAEGGAEHEGIFFIACNADLERQFEFIHQRWVQNPRFGTLEKEDDPIVGSRPCPKGFTIPGLPSGSEVDLQYFTETLGGGYFFLPGLAALNFIVGDRARAEERAPHEAATAP